MTKSKRNPNPQEYEDALARDIVREVTGGKDIELALAEDFLAELDLRLEHVKIYYPFLEMLRRRKVDTESSEFFPELCFLTLAYLIYEGKLRYRGIRFLDLQTFLAKALGHITNRNVNPEQSKKLASELLDGMQNGGRNYVLDTYSFASQSFKEKYVKLLEIKQSEDGALLYYITEQGVDFYLKTKEFPEETKITINLLLFQKQMEKGAFGFAYETVRRLNMEVQKKKDHKNTLLEAMMYGHSDFGESYHNYHHSIVMQFQEEAELFHAAMGHVRNAFSEYVERIQDGAATEQELRTFTLIKIIEKEVSRAQTLHTELLREAVGFTKEYDQALGLRRKAVFTERFNFQGQFEKIVEQNGEIASLKFLFEPLLSPYVRKSFNPLRVLEPQRVVKALPEEEEDTESENLDQRETIDQITSARVRNNFVFYAASMLTMIDPPDKPLTLVEFVDELRQRYGEDCIYNGDFVSFLLEINRGKSIGERQKTIDFAKAANEIKEELLTIEDVFIKAAIATNRIEHMNQVVVVSYPEQDIELLPGLKVTNMVFRGERKR